MKANSRDDQIQDWRGLLKVAQENEAELAGVAPLLAALKDAQTQAVILRSWRNVLAVSAQETTLQMDEAFAAGRYAAIALRSYIRGKLGPRSEKLVQYGISPIRKRPRAGGKSA